MRVTMRRLCLPRGAVWGGCRPTYLPTTSRGIARLLELRNKANTTTLVLWYVIRLVGLRGMHHGLAGDAAGAYN